MPPHLEHLIRGLRYQYLSQFFFPLLLFFEQLLQQVAECLALLCDRPLQQKDSGIHISIPYSFKKSPCPDFQQSTYHIQNSHSSCGSPVLHKPSDQLSRQPEPSPSSWHGRPQLHPFLLVLH